MQTIDNGLKVENKFIKILRRQQNENNINLKRSARKKDKCQHTEELVEATSQETKNIIYLSFYLSFDTGTIEFEYYTRSENFEIKGGGIFRQYF